MRAYRCRDEWLKCQTALVFSQVRPAGGSSTSGWRGGAAHAHGSDKHGDDEKNT
jgi:hypothetical protein